MCGKEKPTLRKKHNISYTSGWFTPNSHEVT